MARIRVVAPVRSRPAARLAARRAAAIAVLLAASPGVTTAQSGRVSGVTVMQAVDLRPLVDDSVPVGEASGTGPYRQLPDGRLVRCVEGDAFCRFRRSGDRLMATPLVQDLRGTLWGFGEGLSAHAHLRARSALGRRDLLWPRAGDEFDALEAWVQLERERYRVRLGRQWTTNGLGLYNFDGLAAAWRRDAWRAEAFAGISLVAGLNETHAGDILGSIDDLPPDERAWLLGTRVGTALGTRGAISGTYQRVIRTDRGSLYSERLAADLSLRALGTSIDAGWIHDLVSGEVNDARLRLGRPLARRMDGALEVRRHRPFFETWTIWGAFSPVAFDEVRGVLGWRHRSGTLGVDGRAGYRKYDDTNAGLETPALRTDGWRAGIGAEWAMRETLLWYGDYDVDIGFGASQSDVTVGGRWTPDEDRFVGAAATALTNIFEFRVGTGRVYGLRLEAGTRVRGDARLVLDGAFYAHRLTRSAPSTDWSQRRLGLRLEWTVGRDPGEAATTRSRSTP